MVQPQGYPDLKVQGPLQGLCSSRAGQGLSAGVGGEFSAVGLGWWLWEPTISPGVHVPCNEDLGFLSGEYVIWFWARAPCFGTASVAMLEGRSVKSVQHGSFL